MSQPYETYLIWEPFTWSFVRLKIGVRRSRGGALEHYIYNIISSALVGQVLSSKTKIDVINSKNVLFSKSILFILISEHDLGRR